MTDRIKGFVVTLEDNVREDDAEVIANAIRILRRVLTVTPYVDTFQDQMNREKVRHELGQELMKVVYPDLKKKKR